MSLRKLFLFSVATLALLTGASAQNIQVDGLQAEEVNASFGDREVTFTASYLNKSITYGKLLVPDELRGDLVDLRSNGRVRTVVDGVGIFQPPGQQDRRLSLAYKFRNDTSVPELQGWQYGEFSGNRNSGLKPKNGEGTVLLDAEGRDRVFTSNFSDQGVRWNITVESHYEHLIINYDLIYNKSGQPAEIVWETQDVYSGEEPEKVTFGANAEQTGNSGLTKNITYDNLYDPSSDYEVLNIVVPNSANITQIDWRGLESQRIDFNYSVAESELESAGVDPSLVLDSLEGYKVRSYNTTFPSDSNRTVSVDIEYESPLREEQDRLLVEESPEFYTYIVGSGGALQVDTTTELCGDTRYDSVTITATVNVCDYNSGKPNTTGFLNITADNYVNITESGEIIGDGSGYQGPYDYDQYSGVSDGYYGVLYGIADHPGAISNYELVRTTCNCGAGTSQELGYSPGMPGASFVSSGGQSGYTHFTYDTYDKEATRLSSASPYAAPNRSELYIGSGQTLSRGALLI